MITHTPLLDRGLEYLVVYSVKDQSVVLVPAVCGCLHSRRETSRRDAAACHQHLAARTDKKTHLPQHLEIRFGSLWQARVECSGVVDTEEQVEVHGLHIVKLPGLRQTSNFIAARGNYLSLQRSGKSQSSSRARTFHCFFSSLATRVLPEAWSAMARTPICNA